MSEDAFVCFMSLWRDDMEREIDERMKHFLDKTWESKRFVWVVGDCEDCTEQRLRHFAAYMLANYGDIIEVVRHDTRLDGARTSVEDDVRLARLSRTGDAGLDWIARDDVDEYVLIHESDLISPPDIVERFLATGQCPVAGAPYLDLDDSRLFYDTWAYRKDGQRFRSSWPPCSTAKQDVIEVDSAGSVLMVYAEDVRAGARFNDGGMVSLCNTLREQYGRKIHFDRRIEIEQPRRRWSC